ncbi:unnamed protein product [marine sediment metagenome]|uniref:Uncharacterized protein n=1 Tax=marine sediment metagenome TaxID=412755 RepID=X0S2F9_9ZZZZ
MTLKADMRKAFGTALQVVYAWLTIFVMLLLMSLVLLVGVLAYVLIVPGYALKKLALRGVALVQRLTQKRKNV